MNDSETPKIIPLQHLGIVDTDLSEVSATDTVVEGLINLWEQGKEGGYAVQHGWRAESDFRPRPGDADFNTDRNYWEKTFAILFPYGTGGPEGTLLYKT